MLGAAPQQVVHAATDLGVKAFAVQRDVLTGLNYRMPGGIRVADMAAPAPSISGKMPGPPLPRARMHGAFDAPPLYPGTPTTSRP